MFERQSLLENADCRGRVDQRALFFGSLPGLGKPLGRRNGRQSFIHEPDGHLGRTSQPHGPLARLHRRRTLATAQTPRQPDEYLDRLVLTDHGYQVGDLGHARPDRAHRIRQHARRITRRDPNACISQVKR
jgi:hypothetical protein